MGISLIFLVVHEKKKRITPNFLNNMTPLYATKQKSYRKMIHFHFKYPTLNHIVPPSDFAIIVTDKDYMII
jgi:hypothetical protein